MYKCTCRVYCFRRSCCLLTLRIISNIDQTSMMRNKNIVRYENYKNSLFDDALFKSIHLFMLLYLRIWLIDFGYWKYWKSMKNHTLRLSEQSSSWDERWEDESMRGSEWSVSRSLLKICAEAQYWYLQIRLNRLNAQRTTKNSRREQF